MSIQIDLCDFDRERAADSATIQDQVSKATTSARAKTHSVSRDVGWLRVDGMQEARAILRFFLGERRMRVDQEQPEVNRPLSAVPAGCDRAVVRVEICRGDGPMECTDDQRSAAPPGEDLRKRIEPDADVRAPAALRADISGACPEFSEPAPQAVAAPDTPDTARRSAAPSLSDQPGGPAVPITLIDRAFPQRGWEHEYGVPSYLVGAADVLHYHRNRVASADGDVIDAAILRLYAPWIRRGAASSPIPQKAEG